WARPWSLRRGRFTSRTIPNWRKSIGRTFPWDGFAFPRISSALAFSSPRGLRTSSRANHLCRRRCDCWLVISSEESESKFYFPGGGGGGPWLGGGPNCLPVQHR